MQNKIEREKLYRTSEVADMFGRTPCTILSWVYKGYINTIRIGNKNYYKGEEIIAALERAQIRKKRKPRNEKNGSNISICEKCLKAYNGCNWSRNYKPVLGWDAKRVKINDYAGKDVYKVKACPEFEEELFYIDENGVKRRVNEVPDEWKVKDRFTNLYEFLE